MSSFTYSASSDLVTTPQSARASAEDPTPCSIPRQGVHQTPRTRTKTKPFTSAVGKIWTTIKKPKNVLMRHVNGQERLRRLLRRRRRESETLPEQPRSCPQAIHTSQPPSLQNPSSPVVGEPAVPGPSSLSLPSHSDPTGVTASDSSISLSSRQDTTPNAPQSPGIQESINMIHIVQDRFGPDGHAITNLSDATTLQNSTAVNDTDNLSRGFSSPSEDANPSYPQLASQGNSQPLRLQTDHLNVPGSGDDDSHSTIRDSSPASAEDLHGIGRHFEESPIIEEALFRTPEG